jgi:GTP-binding protein LepA
MMRVFDGTMQKGTKIRMMSSGRVFEVLRLGVFSPVAEEVAGLTAGEVGFLMAGIKEVAETRIGDTITTEDRPASEPLPGFKPMKPMVFSGLYPTDSGQYQAMREALEKLRLNDSSFTYEPETSQALGFGFRCGFLGLLHMDIVRERLEREFALSLITTAATVVYRIITSTGGTLMIDNPVKLPNESEIERIEEPVIRATLHLPQEFLGGVLKICEEKRGIQKEIRYLGPKRVMLEYELPLNEIVVDFYDRLKSVSRGYASMDYEMAGYRAADLVKLDVRINGDVVDAMSMIVHRDKAYYRGRDLVQKMRELIPRQLFEVVIQAAIGSRIISRESVKPLRKNVTAKCYGGDITRKRKLLERQKEGKKRMKQVGKVEIPQEAFLAALKV